MRWYGEVIMNDAFQMAVWWSNNINMPRAAREFRKYFDSSSCLAPKYKWYRSRLRHSHISPRHEFRDSSYITRIIFIDEDWYSIVISSLYWYFTGAVGRSIDIVIATSSRCNIKWKPSHFPERQYEISIYLLSMKRWSEEGGEISYVSLRCNSLAPHRKWYHAKKYYFIVYQRSNCCRVTYRRVNKCQWLITAWTPIVVAKKGSFNLRDIRILKWYCETWVGRADFIVTSWWNDRIWLCEPSNRILWRW